MFAALVLLVIMIAATPLIAMADGPALQGIMAALAALTVATTARLIPPGEARHLLKLVVPVATCLALPAIWMVIQAAPMPLSGLSHPIWASAEETLSEPLMGSISIDPGATLVAVVRYLTMVGIVIATAAVTIDRRRAEVMLFSLTGATALAGIIVALRSPAALPPVGDQEAARSLIAICALGVPVSAAAVGHMFERYERRQKIAGMSLIRFALAFGGCLGALAICFTALVRAAPSQVLLIAVLGFAIVAGIAFIRRMNISLWYSGAAAATAIVIILAILSSRSDGHLNLVLRYADAPARSAAIAESMMADTGWTGAGGGTFAALLPIYRHVGDVGGGSSAPTAAAEIAVELGQPALWIIVTIIIVAEGFLLRGALTRRRDLFCAAAGAGFTIVLMLEGFNDASGFATSVGVLTAVAFGLGIAQSASRSPQ